MPQAFLIPLAQAIVVAGMGAGANYAMQKSTADKARKQQGELAARSMLQQGQQFGNLNDNMAGGATSMLETAPTSGLSTSAVYGSQDNNIDLIGGAKKMLGGNQENVWNWVG